MITIIATFAVPEANRERFVELGRRLVAGSLAEVGNVASVVVFDVLRRLFENPPEAGARGLLAAFGPGFSAEMALGQWTD